jgi:hypothetical protein
MTPRPRVAPPSSAFLAKKNATTKGYHQLDDENAPPTIRALDMGGGKPNGKPSARAGPLLVPTVASAGRASSFVLRAAGVFGKVRRAPAPRARARVRDHIGRAGRGGGWDGSRGIGARAVARSEL